MAKFSKQVQGANITLPLFRKFEAILREAKIPSLQDDLEIVEESIRNNPEQAEETANGGGEYGYHHEKRDLEAEIAAGDSFILFMEQLVKLTAQTIPGLAIKKHLSNKL